jgi:hypothetical protein
MSKATKRYMIGRYGSGTLWCLKNQEGTFILFNALRIARRFRLSWEPLDKGWRITPLGSNALRVQLNDSDGVIVSLHGEGNGDLRICEGLNRWANARCSRQALRAAGAERMGRRC